MQRRTRQPTCCRAGSGWTGPRRWVKTRHSFSALRSNCCVESAPRIHRPGSMRCIREFPSWSGRRTPVPTRDRRTVGELLADSDSLARETLLDLSADHSAAMVRTWGQVVDAAARLWAVLPPAAPVRRSEPDLMLRLRQMANGIAASTSAGHWPGPGATDQRLLQIAHNLSRARILVERYGGDATRHCRRTGRYRSCPGKDHAHLVRFRSRHRPGDHRTHQGPPRSTSGHPSPSAGGAASQQPRDQSGPGSVHQVRSLRAACWRLCRGAAGHPAVLGEIRPVPPTSRLQSVLAGWDIQAHRTLLANPDAADLVRVSRTQALIASATAVVNEAAASQGIVDRQVVQRVIPFLDETQVAWSQVARRWAELTGPESRVDPLLVRAASQVRATVAATATTPTGWA